MLLLLIVIVSLVVDIGHVITAKNQLQQAVDAAALAGARQISPVDETGSGAIAAAQTTITENDVLVRNVDLDTENVVVTLGSWDLENLGAPFDERWSPGVTPYNAVRVEADVEVEYFFNALKGGSTVSVDALAVHSQTELTLPLAIVSCIPPTGPQVGALNVCGIKTYTFSSNENTAGWTSLTLGGSGGASQTEIADLFDGNGAEQFNRIVELLNDTSVVPLNPRPPTWDENYTGCEGNFAETINCGLGGDFVAYQPSGVDNPLTRYDQLPRYITLSSDELMAFSDIVTQDGVLSRNYPPDSNPDNDETNSAFQARLKELYYGDQKPFGDNRFANLDEIGLVGGEQLIRYGNDKFDFDENGVTNEKVYIPDYNRAIDYAGYPPVAATTGSMTTVMSKLLDAVTPNLKKKKDIQFSAALTDEFPPFNDDYVASSGGKGETLLFTVPVIFAGACGGFDPNSFDSNTAQVQEGNELHYVGLANFLVTRIWKGGDCYECSQGVELSVSLPASVTCDPSDHSPSLVNGTSYSCPVPLPGGSIAFEGLVRPPGFGEGPTGVRAVTYLVE